MSASRYSRWPLNSSERRTPWLCCALLLLPQTVWSASTIMFNGSPAQQCYRNVINEVSDTEPCSLALESQPLTVYERAATFSNRGILLARSGEASNAVKDHDAAIAMAPEIASFYINRANAYTRLKQFEKGLDDLSRAITIADHTLAIAHYNRALMFNRLGDAQSARNDAEQAAELEPESEEYRAFLDGFLSPSPKPTAGAADTDEESSN